MADKVRFELRFESDVYAGIKDIAERADISLNQLMQGISRWAVSNAHVGDLVEGRDGPTTIEEPGCLWFGKDIDELVDELEEDESVPTIPSVAFALDFTERTVVREGW